MLSPRIVMVIIIVMVTSVRLPVHSTVSLSKILNRQLKNAAVLALEKGPISGYVDVMVLNKIRLFCIDLDKPVSIYADRLPGNVFFSVDLSLGSFADHIRAQGVSLSRKALFGFNSGLKDLDLLLPSSAKMCTIAVPCDLLDGLFLSRNFPEARQFLAQFNVLANNSIVGADGLISLLRQCWNPCCSLSKAMLEERLLSFLVDCLIDQEDRKVAPPLRRQDRHAAALNVLSLIHSVPSKYFEVQDLANLLHHSRTSLFSACKEKFGMSPVQVVRSVRLRQVHHALLDTEFCAKNGLQSVSDVSQYFGFASRSQFTKYYKIELMETPGRTLMRRRHQEKNF